MKRTLSLLILYFISAVSFGQNSLFLTPNKFAEYRSTVTATSPLAHWALDDSGLLVESSTGSSYHGSNAANQYHKNFLDGKAVIYNSSVSNIYTPSLNSNMNKAEGSIMVWVKFIRKSDWTTAQTKRLLNIAADDNNRFLIQLTTSSEIQVLRVSGGTVKSVTHSFSSTKPLGWQCIIMTYSVSGNELKMYVNGAQSGSTQTGLTAFTGSLSQTQTCIGAQDTSNTLPLTFICMAHVAIWNSVLSSGTITTLSTLPSYVPTRLTHSTVSWDIFSLFGITGGSMACFAYDVNGDGEKEFVGNIGRRPRFVAVEQNGNVLWDNTVNNTQSEGLRFPQIRNGVLYYGWTNHACAINLTTGATIWNKTPMASPPASGLGGLNQSSVGLVIGVGNKLDILNYATGNSIGGNFPVTLPFDQWEQSLAVGIFGTSTEVIVCNDNFNNMIVYNIDGTIRFQKGPLVGTVNWVNENDWYEFFDYQDSGSKVLGLIGDDDANSTQPAQEGDEFHIYGSTGTQLGKYDDGIHTGGLEFHSFAWPNGGRVAFTHESDYTNTRITMLDKDLNAIWARKVGIPYEGDQCLLLDVDYDGIPEILYSTEVFSQTGGFRVLDYQGYPKYFYTADSPTEATDLVDDKGAAVNIQVSRAPYYWDAGSFIQFTLRTTDNTGHEMIYLHKWTVN